MPKSLDEPAGKIGLSWIERALSLLREWQFQDRFSEK
jgi:hypothetical protein